MKKIAIILAAYNPNDYFKNQIESIIAQINVCVDIFVFDDGSNESCRSIYELYKENANIKFISNESSGSPGRNFIRSIKNPILKGYDFYAFSDQDDIWLDNKLDCAINLMVKNKAHGYSSNLSIYEDSKITGIVYKYGEQKYYDYIFQGASAGCTYVMTKDLFEICVNAISHIEISSIETSVSHDWFVYYIARVNNFNWIMDNNSYILYRQHQGNNFGARISVAAKAKMLLGSWYKSNSLFLNSVQKNNLSGVGFLKRLLFIRHIFEFRRRKIESVVVYFFWLFRGF